MSEQTTPQQASTDNHEQFVATQLAQGAKRDEIVRGLIKRGMNAPAAMQVLTKVQQQSAAAPPQKKAQPTLRQQQAREYEADSAKERIIQGIIILAVGIGGIIGCNALITENSMKPIGLLFTAVVIFGLARTIAGIITWAKYR